MADLTVKKLAEIVGFSADKLLLKMKEASLLHASEDEVVTDADRKKLLKHLQKPQKKSSSTISLNKSAKPKAISIENILPPTTYLMCILHSFTLKNQNLQVNYLQWLNLYFKIGNACFLNICQMANQIG